MRIFLCFVASLLLPSAGSAQGVLAFVVTGPAKAITIRGVTKAETLPLTVSGQGTGSGLIKGTMAFDRRDYGMNSGHLVHPHR